MERWETESYQQRTQQLLNSYQRWLGRELLPHRTTPADDARRLYFAPFVVVAHGTQADPILNFANQTALTLWELDWEQFTSTPSRLTAEPVHRDERARMLAATTAQGYIDDYSGIRISSTGQRFSITKAIVWNVVDETGHPAGQAATFDNWTMLS